MHFFLSRILFLNIYYSFILDLTREPTTPVSSSEDVISPHLPKQGSPFYAEPADSLMPVQVPKKVVTRSSDISTSHSVSPLHSFKLVNFRVKPDREHNEGTYYCPKLYYSSN